MKGMHGGVNLGKIGVLLLQKKDLPETLQKQPHCPVTAMPA